MVNSRRYVAVALSGPLRRTFTYHLPDDIASLSPGQRVLVEFGRSRSLGFYLGAVPAPEVTTKPVLRPLDDTTLFPRDLFDLCCWMADYYFANPADCFASALPPALKSRKPSRLTWGTNVTAGFDPAFTLTAAPGKIVKPAELAALRKTGVTVAELVERGVLVEEWPDSGKRVLETAGYRSAGHERWKEFFSRRRFQPEPHSDVRTRRELFAVGWSEHYLNAAVKAGLLAPVQVEKTDSILEFVTPRPNVTDLAPNDDQRRAIDALTHSLDNGFAVNLLHGVTGSGKTLVYCHVARQVLARDKTVLVLTPEIALTGAALAYFRGFFGDAVTVIHSAMTNRERMQSWQGIRSGRYRVVIGPRSALFAPLDNLGLIVVDEEHDSSYKQVDPAPRFHGRDAAIMRAKLAGVQVLLGSASPSLESYYHAQSGRYRLLELTRRPEGARLPDVQIVDMRKGRLHGDLPYLSFPLKKQIDDTLAQQRQVILYLNRRGYSPQLKCASCGHVPKCPHCDTKLTYHKTGRKLSCHYCGYFAHGYDSCAACGGLDLLYVGVGTQKVEEHLARLYETARVLRFDSDTASGRTSGHRLLHEFAEHKYNLLLGTQMVTKGLDLAQVTLVGVLSADLGLDLPDFRSAEKTFARLLQVAGRCGRGVDPGRVLVQTYYTDSEVIRFAASQDYRAFFDSEIAARRALTFPPFCRMVRFVLAASETDVLEKQMERFASRLRGLTEQHDVRCDWLGPAPCPAPRLRGSYRRHLFARLDNPARLSRLLTAWEEREARFGLPAKVKVAVDVDPDDMM